MSNCLSAWFSSPPLSLSVDEMLDALENTGEFSSPEIAVAFAAIDLAAGSIEQLFQTYEGNVFKSRSAAVSQFLSIHHVERTLQGQTGTRSVAGYIATMELEGVNFVLTAKGAHETARNFTDFRDRCLVEWIQRFYPDMDFRRVSSAGLMRFLNELHLLHEDQLRILRSTIRFPSGGYQRTEKDEPLDVVLTRLEDEDAYLDRVTCSVPGDEGFVGTFSRGGPAMYHGGDLRAFLRAYRELTTEGAARKRQIVDFLSQQPDVYPSAMEIRFSCPVALGSPSEGVGFVEKLESKPLYSVSVLHGNPYLHVTVTDLAHGSSYTLFSHGDQALRLYPGRSADQTSLDHLLSSISDCLSDVSEVTELQTQEANGG